MGNHNSGKKLEKPFVEALRMEIKEGGSDHKRLRRIARQLLETAEAGDLAAIKEVADRLDGKPAQTQDVTITTHNLNALSDAEFAELSAAFRRADEDSLSQGVSNGKQAPRGKKQPDSVH